ncbi:MAG: large repetitive protein [Acidobacteriota bacterium]|jgi:hypothetical protein|nr:large repetitive protein [Acidobacteriota bacterium]
MKSTTINKVITACLALMALVAFCAPAAAQNQPSSDLLLPYFEVDAANPGGLTTLFAVGNASKHPVEVLATLHTNWGIPILEVPFTLQAHEVRTFNLRDWFRQGGDPKKTLAAVEIQHLSAAASGQRSPKDNLYYSSEVRPDLEVGYVILRTQGNRPDALWGDWFNVDVSGNLARGDVLANIDRSIGCPGLCQRHLLRYLSGGGFDGGTEIIIWRENQGLPSATPQGGVKQQADATAFSEPGQPIENRPLALLPVEKVVVSELGFKEAFGSLDLVSEAETFIAVQHTSENRYSVGLTTYCLPRDPDPGPGIDIIKLTNGEDADAAPGPSIAIGDTVTWEYLVTNTGEIELTGIEVEDDQEGAVSCPGDTLDPGETMTCTATGRAKACQYTNVGSVSALSSSGEVTDSDLSHYFGDDGAALSLAIKLNGQNAESSPGQLVDADSTLNWSFAVTNDGKVALSGIQLAGISASCPKTQLGAGESMTCTATGKAQSGLHSLPVSAKGSSSCAEASNSGVGYYQTLPGTHEDPKIKIVKLTNGQDGAQIPAGSPITWTYQVTNIGDVVLSDIHVTDDKGVTVICPKTSLGINESMTCTGSGVAQACQYQNLGTATGTSPFGTPVSASDASSYFGTTQPGISIETAVNGNDADTPKGPEVAAGSPVSFSYVVKNTGNVALTGIQVSDSKGLSLSCPKTTLQPSESMTCTGNGTAQSGQYSSVGTAKGTGACGQQVSDDDPVHYYGNPPAGGAEGCSHGYWKNHEGSWPATGYSTSQKVSSVFSQAGLYPTLGNATLMQSLSFNGGPDVTAAAANMLKQATGSLLNSAHAGVDFPWTTAQLISEVNSALASQNSSVLLGLASQLDHDNTLGCPLN